MKSIHEIGGVVTGVNDGPAEERRSTTRTRPEERPGRSPLFPFRRRCSRMSGRAKLSRKGRRWRREARFWPRPRPPACFFSAPTASGRPRIFDASEGTRLDPLLNKTYDLSYAKVVPRLQ